jgi:hypothetical protein
MTPSSGSKGAGDFADKIFVDAENFGDARCG